MPWMRLTGILLVLLLLVLAGLWWTARWVELRPVEGRGGLWFPRPVMLDVPHFAQADPRWAEDLLGPTEGTLGSEGCAVAAAAMVLAYHGMKTDPGRLNRFLQKTEGGYTDQGWIYWEKAAEFDDSLTPFLLPHYEDLPSYALIDANLLRGNPVIVRLRYPSGITHFVVVVGKKGRDYQILDPGKKGNGRPYPLREFGSPVEALRFYAKPPIPNRG